MDETLLHKFTQHRNLQTELLGTGDAELIEVNIFCLFSQLVLKSCEGFGQGYVLGSRTQLKRSKRTWEMLGEAENQILK